MRFMIISYLLPVEDKISPTHITCGSFAILYSWTTLIQYLKLAPVVGLYIMVIQEIVGTLMKVCEARITRYYIFIREDIGQAFGYIWN